ncbi:MAG: HupE/UreJ family protein, partial [Pseudomonadales bacterium]|nr:HupE/UreJ family protein [Pseudomonadales bacterium]
MRVDVTPAARIEAADFECGALGLSSGRVGIDGLDLTLIDVLVRVERGGDAVSALLKPTAPAIELSEDHNGAAAGAYLGLGIEHILLGFDHLAFVLGLVALVQGGCRLFKTITAFTFAHSIT